MRGGARQFRRLIFRVTLNLLCVLLFHTAQGQRYPFFNIGIEQGLVQSQVFTLTQDPTGHLWAGTLGGLSCYDGHTFRSFTMREGLPSNKVNKVFCDSKGYIWAGTEQGLSRYDGSTFRNFTFASANNADSNVVKNISETSDGRIWCVAGKELFSVSNGKVTTTSLPNGRKYIRTLFAEGNDLWVGAEGSMALYRYKSGVWDSLMLPQCDVVLDIARDSRKRLVIVTLFGGVFQLKADNTWNPVLLRKSPTDLEYLSFAESKDGSYWIGCNSGAFQIKGNEVRHFSKRNGFSDLTIYDLLNDREGNIWLATNGEGLYRYSGATFTAVDERMGLGGTQVSCIAKDDFGNVYFGAFDGGLYRYFNGSLERLRFPEKGSVAISSLSIFENKLWIGTPGYGLWAYDLNSRKFHPYKAEGLGLMIYSLYSDGDKLWIGNRKGLAWMKSDSIHIAQVGKIMVETTVSIGQDSLLIPTPDGLAIYHKNRMIPYKTNSAADSTQIVCMDYRDGIIWLGTGDNGLIGYPKNGGPTIHVTKENGLRSNFIYSIYAAPNGIIWTGTGFGICRINTKAAQPVVRFFGRNAGITGMESNRNAVLPLSDGSIWFGTVGGAFLYHPEEASATTDPGSIQLQKLQLFGGPINDTNWYQTASPLYAVPLALQLPWKQNNLTFTFNAITLTGVEGISYRYRLEGLNAPWSGWSNNNSVAFSALPPGKYMLEVQASQDGIHPLPRSLQYSFEIITPFHKTNLFRLLVLCTCIALGIAIQYIAAYRKRARRAMIEALRREEQAKVRQRTAEDFHDEVGNKLTRINILTNVLRSKIAGAGPDANRIIDQIQDNAGQLYSGTRDILWSLQPSNDSLYQVLHRIREFGLDLFGDTEVAFEMDPIDPSWKEYRLPMDASRNLIMIFKEGLNNTLKYAMADKVRVQAVQVNSHISLGLKDDGQGFDPEEIVRGQGLQNMRTRAKRLGSDLNIESSPGQGTNISLDLKITAQKN